MTLVCQKSLFSLDSDVSYLNNAYRGPILRKSEEAALRDLEGMRKPYLVQSEDFFLGVDRVKSLFAQLIHSQKEQIALVPSTSYGFAVALNNMISASGKKAITVSDEFPSGYFSLKNWAEANDGKLVVIHPDSKSESFGADWNERILQAIDGETSVVLISSVHWMNGVAFDLEAIGKKCCENGAVFIVDGTQSVGMQPMDVERFGIDALICATYKWLLGPYSLALAYFGERFNSGKPLEESWMNRTNSRNFSGLTDYQETYLPGAAKYDVGETSHFLTLPILEQSLIQILEWTPEAMLSYARGLKEKLAEFQLERGLHLSMDRHSSDHLFALTLPTGSDPQQVKKQLEQAKVFVSVRGTSLRVSVNVFNEEKDVERLKGALIS
ncbi:aminotransferase class V-fold PLP-dependent enzyme [Algoriphagus taiwanensis]|uniref:Aminotransferase class V-fold PLP-dependent enzyme n=1 Tax=Algoriphagus taiwanensis TaxID=1445656 RepID=A0ABQ6PWV1_9BACT|nr:aminotransferase class V-fold PLP-dependent enzyme [Algoriphagus taiwanensis]